MNKTSKRVLAVGMPLTIVAATGIAFATWSATGGGTGAASAQAVADAVIVHQTSTISNLSPGSPAQSVAGTIENVSYATETISGLTFSITSTGKAGCVAGDFTLVQPTTVPSSVLVDDTSAFSGGSVAMNTAAPDACKGAALVLTYVVS